jgi:membrane-bound ClpP family serine protease
LIPRGGSQSARKIVEPIHSLELRIVIDVIPAKAEAFYNSEAGQSILLRDECKWIPA